MTHLISSLINKITYRFKKKEELKKRLPKLMLIQFIVFKTMILNSRVFLLKIVIIFKRKKN